jgi:hypothetical protein
MPDLSLKAHLQSFVVPLTSARALASRYVVDTPVSIRDVLSPYAALASQIFHFPLDADTVAGWTDVEIRSDGLVGFRGHVHESGALSHHFNLLVVINVMVDVGTPLILENGALSAWVHGTAGFGSRDNDWSVTQYTKYSHSLAEQWDVVRSSPSNYAIFDVNTGIVEITEALGAVAAASALVIGAEQLASRIALSVP